MNHQEMKIGLETHVTLDTDSKLFCGCSTGAADFPNQMTCEICLGLPGSKPRLNKKAVILAVQAAYSLGMKIRRTSRFARKTYYYPDLSKNFQITQYNEPLAEKGILQVGNNQVDLTRLHIEEDPAQIVYPHGNMVSSTYVLLDYNRSGMPLLEIVTEPCLKTPSEAKQYLEALFRRLSYLRIIDSVGERVMKTDANLSVPGGERVEIKNITSFAAVEKALQSEYFRQRKVLAEGKTIERQTRLYSEETNTTILMRTKEQEEDYGYVVEPDLPSLFLSEKFIHDAQKIMPELPEKAVLRLKGAVPDQYADILVYQGLLPYFESSKTKDKVHLVKWICGDLLKCMNFSGLANAQEALQVTELDGLLAAITSGRITERAAKEYIQEMVAEGKNLKQVLQTGQNPRNFKILAKEILAANPKAVTEFQKGKPEALEFLVGEFLKREKSLHPNEIRKALLELFC